MELNPRKLWKKNCWRLQRLERNQFSRSQPFPEFHRSASSLSEFTLWHPLALCGTLWHPLALCGILWHLWHPLAPVASPGTLWHPLAPCGIPWHSMASPCTLWHPLALCGILWHPVASPGTLWHPLANEHIWNSVANWAC
ncbi:hypothetical protein CHARACLAT_023450 [Characodon lateralis]|uniref:Uncharacterized protein n=1 Tax=Characodon lateralis TaxID=208331 RepID=A0ABU7E2X5_9TELE|nr:hypothetical protein [Characodon lateralis]